MSRQSNDYGWIGWIVALVIGIIFILFIVNTDNNKNNASDLPNPETSTAQPETETVPETEQAQAVSSWHCVDATSYNQNAYDDNACSKDGETRYVSDSQARELDPSYSPGEAGASYYNNQ